MEIYVDGRPMPHNENNTVVIVDPNGTVKVEVRNNHGRLIDADAFIDSLEDELKYCCGSFRGEIYRMIARIQCAPTVIDATEGHRNLSIAEKEVERRSYPNSCCESH